MRADYRRWTDDELDFLRANYRLLGPRVCAERLNRTIQQIYEYAHKIGVTNAHTFERGPRVPIAPPPSHPAVKPPEPPRTAAVYDSGFIRPPSLKRLMAGKA